MIVADLVLLTKTSFATYILLISVPATAETLGFAERVLVLPALKMQIITQNFRGVTRNMKVKSLLSRNFEDERTSYEIMRVQDNYLMIIIILK